MVRNTRLLHSMYLPRIPIYIGYDQTEIGAYHTLVQSILKHSTSPVAITPVKREHLGDAYTRPRGATESTEFSMTRFLVPYLHHYDGWAIFMDCDMLCRSDITELWKLRDDDHDVMVCQHDYTPNSDIKMEGAVQTKYEKKNWSSLMLMNTSQCRDLTPRYVNDASGLELHQFHWARSVGSLPLEWNWLVGEYYHNKKAHMVHYTLGGPWLDSYFTADYSDEWRDVNAEISDAA